MNILETVLNAHNGAAVRQIGSQLGLPDDQTTAALSALVPALAAGVHRNAESGGLDNLLAALAGGRHARYLDTPATLSQPDTIADGNGILAHVFGSKDVSRQVASRAAEQTGIGADVLKQMLPMAAALVMGTLARQSATNGPGTAPLPAGQAGGLLSALTSTLDRNNSGSMLDEVTGICGRALQK